MKDVLLFEEYVFNELLQLYSWIKGTLHNYKYI